MKILMVCLGNICRSPLAEGIMRHKAAQRNLAHIEVDSCGTAGYHVDEAPDPRSIKKAREKGFEIGNLKGRQFQVSDFEKFDRIFVMDTENHKNIVRMARTREEMEKVQLMMDVIYPGEKINVPDPYYGDYDGFEEVFQMLEKACDSFLVQSAVNEG
jgi:protein-tyrosine phosphatase